MQNQTLTPNEIRVLSANRMRRLFLTFVLFVLIIFVVADLIFLLGVMHEDMPEWVLIPFVLGLIAAGTVIGIACYLPGKLRRVEKARFVLISIRGLLESKSITERKLVNTFKKTAGSLINNSSTAVASGLVSDGWQKTRAQYLTELIESLIIKCEWNINSEDYIAGFAQMLQKNNWRDNEAAWITAPVQELITAHGGRLTRSGIARSITRNVLWILTILIMAPIMLWMLLTFEVIDNQTKYDFIKFLIFVIPAIGALVYILVQIARRRCN